ncbi:hypothetical protein [Streptomyces sp. 35G-GA-8]|uniref:hypothetical protein n=1 Tax=Streptomyces sp. 35G-GA-8 TaxID=2939434 RepID=UPI00201F15D1|nr:hypothetical protein [Streptomyces sp. 35G-GA-8]MCL7376997.1 hypothetical protein [Streptomyces sp. 35G-GA-8]
MIAVDYATTPLSGSYSTQDETMRRLVLSLSRSLADEGISDDLVDVLEGILGEQTATAPAGRSYKTDDLLVRLGLPLPRRKPQVFTPSLSEEEVARIGDRFRRAIAQLTHVVPHRVSTYPTEELRLLLALRDERPEPGAALAHLRRVALAILNLLDLMGDDE